MLLHLQIFTSLNFEFENFNFVLREQHSVSQQKEITILPSVPLASLGKDLYLSQKS